MITVIEQTTAERRAETIQLFNAIRPLLDTGYTYMKALIQIGYIPPETANWAYSSGWFKDLKEYGASKGYPYHEYKGKGKVGK